MESTALFFFGSDQYSATVLSCLITANSLQLTVVTDHKSDSTPVEKLAIKHNIKILYYPANQDEMIKFIYTLYSILHTTPLPLGLCASFPHLFPADLIKQFGGQLYNLHPSLLPQYRNVAPVPYALAMGDQETGITLQRIDEKIDHGEIIAQAVEPILPGDTTPLLLHRLFTQGAELFLRSDLVGCKSNQKPTRSDLVGVPLIFTHKLTPSSGYLEWPIVLKLINRESITPSDTANPLIRLRLTHHPDRQANILPDLIRALEGYEKVWTTVPTKKGDLRISIVYTPGAEIRVLIPGKPRPISWSDFQNYYL